MWVFWRLSLLTAVILMVNFHLAIRHGEFAEPVSVALEGFSGAETDDARLYAVYIGSDHLVPKTQSGDWECPPRCLLTVGLRFPAAAPAGNGAVRVQIGAQTFLVPFRELRVEGDSYLLPDHVIARQPPVFAMCRNWPGMQAFGVHFLKRSAPGLATILILGLAVAIGMHAPFRSRFQAILGMTDAVLPHTACADCFWNLVGWIGLIGGFVALEFLEPYYFTQDDSLVGELPGILLGCRSLWQGTFPDWNPYVFMGAPLATIGFWAITYPPQLLSYAIARHVLHDEFALMEVFAALHLLAGFIAMRHLSRRIGMGPMSANLSALSFVFAGCILIMGRSWQPFIANAIWLPLLGIAIQQFREGPVGWKWIIGVGLVLGLSYHSGFPQIVAILGMFLVAGVVSVSIGEGLSLRRVAPVVPAISLGVGLAAPLLLHHLALMGGGHERFVPMEHGVYDGLHAAVLPYPFAEAGLPTNWGSTDFEMLGHFYFFGGLFAVLFALQAIAYWACFPDRASWSRNWWILCGIVALLMVLGEPAGLWTALSALPMSKIFLRYSFRFYPWLAFCAILGGGLMLDRILACLRGRRAAELLIGAALLGVLAWHLAMCRPSFYSYGFRPYPALPADFESAFHPHADKSLIDGSNSRRLASWYNLRSPAPDYYQSLPLNLPHYYQVPSIFGYDPVVEGQPRVAEVQRRLQQDPLAACKAYGVGWHLFSYSDTPVKSPNPGFWTMEAAVHFAPAYRGLLKANLKVIAEHDGTTLKELPGVDSLAFETGRPERALPMRLHCGGSDIDVNGLAAGARVTINFLHQPHIYLDLDGQSLTVESDDWQRITTTLPVSGSTLSLRYQPPWGKTCGVGAAICAVALLLGWGSLRLRELQPAGNEKNRESTSA